MEHCSKCGKALPKIFGIYLDTCHKDDNGIICDACNRKKLAKIGEIINKNSKSQNSKSTKEDDIFFEKKITIKKDGKKKTIKTKQCNERNFGKIKIYISERQFEIIPLYQKYKIDDVISYELIENSCVKTKGGIGGAIVGSAIAGVPGALIGYDKTKKQKNFCSEYRILIRMKGHSPINIGYIGGGVNVAYDSSEFLDYKRNASATIEGIEYILKMTNQRKR